MKIRIYYEDTDAGGVVYHTNYIKYCERARSEMLFEKGIFMDNKNGYFLVKSLDANFIKPAMLADIVEVKTNVVKYKKASALINQCIYRNDEKLFEANITIVYMKENKITAISEDILALLL